jgi:hypothetical protein
MSLAETLALTIGASIAKNILQIWLKDHSAIASAGSGIIDILKSKTQDALAARNGARRFEDLGDKVALTLIPVFGAYKLEESSLESIAREVSDAITSADISTKLLASLSYEPTKLVAHIKKRHPNGDQLFSESEAALYNRAIDLASQYLIDLASNLPEYESQNFSEILQRLEELMTRVDTVINDLDRLQATSSLANTDREYADFERDYRASLTRKLDRVEIFGADVPRAMRRYQLSVAYVSLNVSSFENDEEESSIGTLPVQIALAKSKRSAIIGEAGSGKTTLLQWLAVKSATNSFETEMVEWADSVPFFIELRRYLDSPPSPEHFLEKVVPEIADRMPKNWVHDLLKSGRATLLVDGLDEVSPQKRREVLKWLEDLIETFQNVRVVFTSRPAAYSDRWLEFLDFCEFELAPMEMREIEMFLDFWHKAVLKDQGLESDENIRIVVEKLSLRIKNNVPLLRLASNPLLCAMICALHYDRHMQLPADRNALYESCCSMLLERRDVEKEVLIGQYPQLTYKQKRVILDDLAYWMLKNGYSSIKPKRAIERMAVRLGNMHLNESDQDVKAILRMLIERSGIIRMPVPDSMDFVHRSFQEFMAANAVSLESDWGVLVQNAGDDRWQETIILAAGLANKHQSDELISGILRQGDEKPAKRSYFDLLAISCLETVVEISVDVRTKVQERLHSIIPPRSTSQLKALAAAGDMAVPYLDPGNCSNEDEAVACIEVLSMISTRIALTKLSAFISNPRKKVAVAFRRALMYFTPEDIASTEMAWVLLDTLTGYVDGNVICLSGTLLHSLSRVAPVELTNHIPGNVTRVELTDCSPSNALVLSELDWLKSLSISGDLAINLEPLSRLPGLTDLDLRSQGRSWPEFGDMMFPSVKSLCFHACSDSWPDFDDLDSFPNVERLVLFSEFGADFPELNDVMVALKYTCSSITYLHLATLNGTWPDLAPLVDLSLLTHLELSTATSELPDDIVGIEELTDLKKLTINVGPTSGNIERLRDEMRIILPGCRTVIRKGWTERKLHDDLRYHSA